jgi:AcrR family transcriptional regulator
MDERTETRDRILAAAMQRILYFGYAKTTMAEIAADCSMSAGNIYRFFASKLDIAEAMARKLNIEVQQTYSALARDTSRPAVERLRELFSFTLRRTYEILASKPQALEVAEVLASERIEFANEEMAQQRIFLVRLFEQGVKEGTIAPGDHAFRAEMLQAALMKFTYPQLWTRLTLSALEREMNGVFDLVLVGLSPRPGEQSLTQDNGQSLPT